MNEPLYFINLEFISRCQSPKLTLELEVQDLSSIIITSFDKEKGDIFLYSDQKEDLSLYVLRQGETKTFYSLLGVQIEARVPLTVKVPRNFFNENYNLISLYRLSVDSIPLEV